MEGTEVKKEEVTPEVKKEETKGPGEPEQPKEIEDENETNEITNRQKRQEGFLKNLESGVSILKASKAAGIAYVTIWRWRRDDPEFEEKVTTILDSRIMIVEDALFLNAAKGNLGAQIFWLKNRSNGRWKDKTEQEVELNHKGLDYKEYVLLKGMTKDERTAFIADLGEIIRCGNVRDAGKGKSSNQEESMVISKDNIPEL